ncbi:MAG TPA: CDP-diacylglycerol--serine O-phosphatidyltransferase [Longimicrobiales bacterium]|nr:CDP-diacylglycerol--serine O-phosphatidyltransferase [Longimicrobiales bacterium]
MMRAPRPPSRQTLQRGVVILPSAFTLGNLFFGIYAMVAASRGEFVWAGWCIIFAGTLDVLDGSVARFTRTGSRFGAELDSLVDAISFGVAPGFIMYRLFFADTQWSWIVSFVYVTAVVVRLARFNIEQGGEAKRHFNGLPSPAAGMTLAAYYPWTQTAFFDSYFADLPWPNIVGVGMVLLAVLLVSHVPYARFPKIGLRTRKGITNTILVLLGLFAAFAVPRYFLFSLGLLYIVWGLLRSVILGLLDRLPGGDPLLDEDEDDEADVAEPRTLDYAPLTPGPRGRRIIDDDDSQEDHA